MFLISYILSTDFFIFPLLFHLFHSFQPDSHIKPAIEAPLSKNHKFPHWQKTVKVVFSYFPITQAAFPEMSCACIATPAENHLFPPHWTVPVSYTHLDVYKRQPPSGTQYRMRWVMLPSSGNVTFQPSTNLLLSMLPASSAVTGSMVISAPSSKLPSASRMESVASPLVCGDAMEELRWV